MNVPGPLLPFLSALVLATAVGPLAAAEPLELSDAERAAFGLRTQALDPVTEAIGNRLPARVTVPNRQLRVVSAPQPGLLEQVLVAEGDRVEPGQVVALIRSPSLLDLQREFLAAQARLDLARESLRRDEQLFEDGIISERRYKTTRAEMLEAEATLKQHRQRLLLAGFGEAALAELAQRDQLSSSLEVTTPLGGVVLDQMGTPGELIDAATPILRIGQLDRLWLEIHTPLDSVVGVAAGARVQVPELGLEGRVITVGRQVHGQDQGVLVRAVVEEGADLLRPGQFVEAQLCVTCGAEVPAFRVPRAAVFRENGEAFVFSEQATGFVAVPVRVVAEEIDSLIVEGEFAEDSAIVVSGTISLKAYWLQQREGL
jgi:RND family efflux transporter MFP subunit